MDTRGILRPGQVGRVFELARPAVPPRLRDLVASFWAVTWSLPDGEARRSEVLPHPAVHLVAERDGVWVYGVPTAIDVRMLSGSGFATVASRPAPRGVLLEHAGRSRNARREWPPRHVLRRHAAWSGSGSGAAAPLPRGLLGVRPLRRVQPHGS